MMDSPERLAQARPAPADIPSSFIAGGTKTFGPNLANTAELAGQFSAQPPDMTMWSKSNPAPLAVRTAVSTTAMTLSANMDCALAAMSAAICGGVSQCRRSDVTAGIAILDRQLSTMWRHLFGLRPPEE